MLDVISVFIENTLFQYLLHECTAACFQPDLISSSGWWGAKPMVTYHPLQPLTVILQKHNVKYIFIIVECIYLFSGVCRHLLEAFRIGLLNLPVPTVYVYQPLFLLPWDSNRP